MEKNTNNAKNINLTGINSEDVCQLAQGFAIQGQYSKAISIYESALKLFPDDFSIRVGLNRTKDLHDQSIHNQQDGVDPLDKSLPSIIDENELTYHRLLGAGELLFKNKEYVEAKQLFELCKVYSKRSFLPYFYLGKIAHLEKQPYRAIEELEEARKINPFRIEMLDLLAKSYFEVQQYENALRSWIDGLIISAKSEPEKRREFKLCIEQAQLKLTGFTESMRNAWVHKRQKYLKDSFDKLKEQSSFVKTADLTHVKNWGDFASAEDLKTQIEVKEKTPVSEVMSQETSTTDPELTSQHVSKSEEDEHQTLIEKMKRHLVFKNLDPKDLIRIAKFTSEVRIREYSFVYHESDPVFGLYFIDRGMVQINKNTPYGKIEFSTFMRGSFFGDDSLLNGTERFTSAQCLEESDLLFLDKAGLAMIFAREKRLAIHFLWYLWKSLSFQVRDSHVKMNHFFGNQKGNDSSNDRNIEIDHKLEVLQTKRLSEKELTLLSRLSNQEVYNTDETIFKEGDSGDRLYIVLEGNIEICKHTPEGDKALSTLERGDFFGEMALAGNEHLRLTDAKAVSSNTKLLVFTRQALKEILAVDTDAAYQFLTILCKILSQRLREMNEKIYQWKLMEGSFK